MSTNPRTLLVISVCSECGEPVGATKNDIAYRHGFKRFKKRLYKLNRVHVATSTNFSQEDGKRCEGSGKPVVYKRYHAWKKK